ncbi:MAG: hypothetical protein KDA47_22115 [Planctomycetales bacterium]|nr:hypothetical protein [Planctomycetales bacterium]
MLLDHRCSNAVETAEFFADGLASAAELRAACDAAYDVHQDIVNNPKHPTQVWDPYTLVPQACAFCAGVDAPSAAYSTSRYVADVVTCCYGANIGMDPEDAGFDQVLHNIREAEERIQAGLLRDIFGPIHRESTPFHNVPHDPVGQIAEHIYEQQAFEQIEALGESLGQFVSDSDPMVRHCRESKQHVRGCWVVDVILGRS